MSRPHRPRSARPEPPSGIVELTIAEIGARGDGVASWQGTRVYVPLTVPGDRVRVRLEGPRGEGLGARLLEVLAPGPDRAPPPCPAFGRCGGCTLQHLTGSAYAAWKRDQVRRALARAGLGEVPVAVPVATPPARRRRATFAARRGRDGVHLGFHARLSHRLVDLDACLVLDPAILAVLPALRGVLAEVLPVGAGLDIAVTRLEGGLDVVLVGGPEPDLAARERLARFAESVDLARLSLRRAPGQPAEPLAHRRPVWVRFGGVPVVPPPGAFLQASPEGEAALVAEVVRAVAGAGPVADLFAGCGTFTLALAAHAPVHAVEADAEALAALAHAGRTGTRFPVGTERRDLFEHPLGPDELDRYAAVVFDPPRAGARAQAAALARSRVPLVVGVSCNPATFARDAALLAAGGYRLDVVVPVDQFLWSAHVELVGVLRRRSSLFMPLSTA